MKMVKKKQSKLIYYLLIVFVIGLLFLTFGLQQSVIPAQCETTNTVVESETNKGVTLKLTTGGCNRDTKDLSPFARFTTSPSKETDFQYIAKINGEFALSEKEFTTNNAQLDIEYERNVWNEAEQICYGDWARWITQSKPATAVCTAINFGTPGNPRINNREDFTKVGMTCVLNATFGADNWPCTQRLQKISGGSVNIFIPKKGFEKIDVYNLVNNQCQKSTIFEKDLINQYISLIKCESDIQPLVIEIPEEEIIEEEIIEEEILKDILPIEEEIIEKEIIEENNFTLIIIIGSIVIVVLIMITIFLFKKLIKKRKKKRK
ncbi:hypothetical protein CL617_04900 [archaeon]|nr:hypothetical protein [archaeon]